MVKSGLLTVLSNGFVLYVGLRVKKKLFEKPILRCLTFFVKISCWPQRYFKFVSGHYWYYLKLLTPPISSSLAFVDFMTGIICTPVVILTYFFSKCLRGNVIFYPPTFDNTKYQYPLSNEFLLFRIHKSNSGMRGPVEVLSQIFKLSCRSRF